MDPPLKEYKYFGEPLKIPSAFAPIFLTTIFQLNILSLFHSGIQSDNTRGVHSKLDQGSRHNRVLSIWRAVLMKCLPILEFPATLELRLHSLPLLSNYPVHW